MSKASIMACLGVAVVLGELVGWSLGLGPLAAAKTVMLGALVWFNCLKLGDNSGSRNDTGSRAGTGMGQTAGAEGSQGPRAETVSQADHPIETGERAEASPRRGERAASFLGPGGQGRLVA